jgi:fibronectin type 3 domain-containing protein
MQTVLNFIAIIGGGLAFGLASGDAACLAATPIYQFDCGTSNSPVQAGYSRVTKATAYGSAGYGWITPPCGSMDRPECENRVNRDFVYGTSRRGARVFRIDAKNGLYRVRVVMGDSGAAHHNMMLKANGKIIDDHIESASGRWTTKVFSVFVTEGKLDLTFSGSGGGDDRWVVNEIAVFPSGDDAGASAAIHAGYKFDMGTETSPLAAGHDKVTGSTMVSVGGYGWMAAVVQSIDRASCNDPLKRDLVYGNPPATFRVYLENGIYEVKIVMGDDAHEHDDMQIRLGKRVIDTSISNAAGQWVTKTFKACAAKGYLDFTFSDGGGIDSCWVVNALELSYIGPPPVAATAAPAFYSDDAIAYDVKVTADATGASDATIAFQTALDNAADLGGGVVYASPGRYRIEGTLVIPLGVVLRGEWKHPDRGGLGKGTILQAYSGKDDGNAAAFLRMGASSGLKNLSVWYPEQKYDDVRVYPPTISGYPPQGDLNLQISNLTLYNSYKGIELGTTAASNASECYFSNIFGTVLHTGIRHDRSFDVARYQNIKFATSYWSNSRLDGAPATAEALDTLKAYTRGHARGIVIEHEDWYFLDNIDLSDLQVGFEVSEGALMSLTRLTTNDVNIGVKLRAADPGIQIAYSTINAGVGEKPACIYFGNTSAADSLLVTNTVFGGTPRNAIYVAGNSGGTVSIHNCRFRDWGQDSDDYAIHAQGVGLGVTNCTFDQTKKHIFMAESVRGAIIGGNTFRGGTAPYCAQGDGLTDDTEAVQRALDDVARAGGGTVYLPPGRYAVHGNLLVPSGVELRGSRETFHSSNYAVGTEVFAYAGKDEARGTPFIRLSQDAGVRGLTLYYPEQGAEHYSWYPWTIQGLGPGCWVKHLCLTNPAQGIDMMTHRCDNHVISECLAAPIWKGVAVGRGTQGGYLQNFHVHGSAWTISEYPHIPVENVFFRWQADAMTAFEFGACKNYSNGFNFEIFAKTGVHFGEDPAGSYRGTLYQFANDACNCPFQIDQAEAVDIVAGQNVASWGVDAERRFLMVTSETFIGTANVHATTLFGSTRGPVLANGGTVNLVQTYSSQADGGTFEGVARAGTVNYYCCPFARPTKITFLPDITNAVMRACLGKFSISNSAGQKMSADNNSNCKRYHC